MIIGYAPFYVYICLEELNICLGIVCANMHKIIKQYLGHHISWQYFYCVLASL